MAFTPALVRIQLDGQNYIRCTTTFHGLYTGVARMELDGQITYIERLRLML